MDEDLSPEELDGLKKLNTDDPVKVELSVRLSERLLALGLAIRLVEGGLQLTELGRARLQSRR